jgi:putative spermidine/putrescine transport system permease protein
VSPFFLFVIAFILLPAGTIITGSFLDEQGQLTLNNLLGLGQPAIISAYWISIRLSVTTALAGAMFGFLLAYAVVLGGLPAWVRNALTTFSGVASNFAGVPLAFAFIATLGRTGLITAAFKGLGVDLYGAGFNLYSFWGLSLTYLYFQFPLMVLIISPVLEGLKREWREAAENLGATSWQYWRYIAFPILLPPLMGTTILLFGNSFGAYATAFALTGGLLNLVPIVLGQQIAGDVLFNPGLGYAIALGMIAVMAISLAGNTWLQRYTERWIK